MRTLYDRRALPDLYFTKDYTVKNAVLFLKGDDYPPYMYNCERMIKYINRGIISFKKNETL